jgi:hypothetical protein
MTATETANLSRRRLLRSCATPRPPHAAHRASNLDHIEIEVPNHTLTSRSFGEGSAGLAEGSEKQDASSIPCLGLPPALFAPLPAREDR